LTGSFILRAYSLPKYGVLPKNLTSDLATKAPNFDKWAKEVIKHPSVTSIWDEETVAARAKERIEKMRAQA
jgi:glutathione S-transferase